MSMKNNYAWAIIVLVLIIAGGAIWFMMSKSEAAPVDTSITSGTDTTGTKPATGTKPSGTTGSAGTAATDTRPTITSIAPASGKVATVTMIKGTNFDSMKNVITFGPSKGLHRTDGSADNQVTALPSSDGKTLTFKVPTTILSGHLCDQSNACAEYGPGTVAPGTYMVTVINKDGLSNEMPFVVTN